MADWRLPRNSRIKMGTTYHHEGKVEKLRRLKVYRWDPDTTKNPTLDTFEIDIAPVERVYAVLVQ